MDSLNADKKTSRMGIRSLYGNALNYKYRNKY
jgi:hypothetical protein